MRKGAAIARVSTQSQKDNTSPDGQLQRIKEYARQNDIDLIHEFIEVESGGVILARAFNPQSPIYKCLRLAERGEIDCIIADVPDRWGRGDVIPILEFMFQRAGAAVLYAAPGRDKDTMAGFVAHSADMLVSGIERLRIRERMMGGKLNAVRRGQLMLLGRPPYGYEAERQFDAVGRRTSTRLIPIATDRLVYLRMVDMVMRGGLSMRAVAKRLTDDGVPAPDVRHGKRDAAAPWRASSVTKIMRSPVYGGRWYYGRLETKSVDTTAGRKSRQVRARSLDEMPYIEVEGFITWAEWQALQARIDTHGDLFIKPTKNQYLLRGLLRCAACGYTLTGVPVHHHGGIDLYYRCRPARHKAEERCHARALNARDVEAQVWAQFCAWLLDDGMVARLGPLVNAGNTIEGLESALRGLEKQKTGLGDELRRALQAYTRALAGATLAMLEEEQARIDTEMKRIDKEIQTVRGAIDQAQEGQRAAAGAGQLRGELAARLGGGVEVPFEVRRQWLRAARLAGVWDSDTETLSITCVFGSADMKIQKYAARRR
jgi:site-specific DNA recombinase